MKKIFLLFLFLLVYFCSFSQTNSLIITKKAKDKQKIIEEDNSIIVNTYSGKELSGDFSIPNDSNLVITGDTILLSDIENITYKSKSGKILGAVVTSIGSILFLWSLVIFIIVIVEGGWLVLLMILLGVPMAIISVLVFFGGIMLLKKGKKYKSSKWNYKIRKK